VNQLLYCQRKVAGKASEYDNIRNCPFFGTTGEPCWQYNESEQSKEPTPFSLNAGGEVRNASYFWQQLIDREPQMFSQGNLYRVQELGLSPRVDAAWVEYNPTHQSFMNDVLAHHHIDQGPIAVPLPQTVHQQWTSVLHGN
jgi:hypothetical protein